jgi:hypothetical protein
LLWHPQQIKIRREHPAKEEIKRGIKRLRVGVVEER